MFRVFCYAALVSACCAVASVGGDFYRPPERVSPLPAVPDAKAGEEVWYHLPPNELQPDSLKHPRAFQAGDDAVDWSVAYVGAEKAWAKGFTGKGVRAGVIDTGVDANHKDLKDAIKKVKDFTGSRFGGDDRVGHGTHVAGSVGARKNRWGVQGVAYECDLYIYKALGDNGAGRSDWIAAAIDEAVKDGVQVLNLSLGSSARDSQTPPAIQRAVAAGVIVVCAAGNDFRKPVSFPAAYDGAFAVSAVDKLGALADFSNLGAQIRMAGPGVGVRSCYPGPGDGLFADMSGTSMASPNCAGVAAVWVSADKGDPKTRPERFDKWLRDTGKPRTNEFGFGVPDLSKLGDVAAPPQPKPPAAGAGLTLEQVEKLAELGPVIVYHKVPVGSDGYVLLDGPDTLPPGKYEVDSETKLKFVKK